MRRKQPEPQQLSDGQLVKVTISGVIADSYEDDFGKRHLILQFETDRRRLLDFPADAESVTVEAVQP